MTTDAARGAVGEGGGRHPPAAPAVVQGVEPRADREPEIFRLRARLEPIGPTIYTIRGRGVVLDYDARPTHHAGAAAPAEMPMHTSEETTWLRS